MTKTLKRVTLEEINAARTPRGGWTRKQLEAWGLEWPVKSGWVRRLTGDDDARVDMPGRTKQAIDLARKTRLQLEEENVKLAAENAKLRAALVKAREQMKWLAEHERECLGVVPMDDGTEIPAIFIAVSDLDAALEEK